MDSRVSNLKAEDETKPRFSYLLQQFEDKPPSKQGSAEPEHGKIKTLTPSSKSLKPMSHDNEKRSKTFRKSQTLPTLSITETNQTKDITASDTSHQNAKSVLHSQSSIDDNTVCDVTKPKLPAKPPISSMQEIQNKREEIRKSTQSMVGADFYIQSIQQRELPSPIEPFVEPKTITDEPNGEYADIDVPIRAQSRASGELTSSNKYGYGKTRESLAHDYEKMEQNTYEPMRHGRKTYCERLSHKTRCLIATPIIILLIFGMSCGLCWAFGYKAGEERNPYAEDMRTVPHNACGTCSALTNYLCKDDETVLCRPEQDGWLVWLRRVDNSVQFNRTWNEYVKGFGNPSQNYWLGLKYLNLLTAGNSYKLRIEIWSTNKEYQYAEYGRFSVGDITANYSLKINTRTNGAKWEETGIGSGKGFATHDSKHMQKCVTDGGDGGWWYNTCNPNDIIAPTGIYNSDVDGAPHMSWRIKTNTGPKITRLIMKMKRN